MEERRKLPKNVRQVGERDELYRIYLEDYVGTYLEKCMSRQGELTIGVLVGESCVIDGNACLFITGAMEVNHVWSDEDQLLFSEYSWERMLDAKSRHFNGTEICGCFVCAGEEILPDQAVLQKLENRYFPETGNVMLVQCREESAVYYQNMAGMSRLNGYYIYYERNEAMQSFLVENSQGRVVERPGEEVVVNQFREKMTEKKNLQKPAGLRMAYGLCACLALAVCALAVNMMGSSQKLSKMEELMEGYAQQNAQVGATVSETDEAGGQLTIYDVTGGAAAESTASEATSAQTPETEAAQTEAAQTAAAEGEDAAALEGTEEETPASEQPLSPEPEDVGALPDEEQPLETEGPAEETGETEQISVLPEVSEEEPVNALPEGCMVYTVNSGDTLSSICMGLYGSHDQMSVICELNSLEDANMISEGQELIVPTAEMAENEPE